MKARPDILWIVTTQWRASATGYAGDANARTPALDALARSAVNFTQAVTPHPFGPFARAALLTGVRSPANGVRDYFDPLPADARTVAHELAARGYAAAFFGKWHLGRRDPAAALVGELHAKTLVPPEARGGFGFWEGFESGFLLNDPWLHGTRLPAPVRFPGYQSDVVCGRAAEWIAEWRGLRIAECGLRIGEGPGAQTEARSSPIQNPQSKIQNGEPRPWFALVSLEAPHPPYDAAAAGVARRRLEEIALAANVPRGGEAERRARTELAGYYAHIEATDRAIGRLIAAVDAAAARQGRAAPLVVFTSAHGDMHGAHGLFRKGWPHEESVRVPLLMRPPGESAAGAGGVSDAPVSLAGLTGMMKEIAECGVRIADRKGGGAREGFARISMPSVVRLPHQCDRAWRGMRTAQRKLVLNEDGSPWLFFDLENDPLEMRNLAGDPAWRAEIAQWRERAGSPGD